MSSCLLFLVYLTLLAVARASSSSQRNDGHSFLLTRLKNAPSSHNGAQHTSYTNLTGVFLTETIYYDNVDHAEGAVGIQDLLEGEFTRCLLTNYMFDLAWLFGECPRLTSVPVVLVHGERDRHRWSQARTSCCLNCTTEC